MSGAGRGWPMGGPGAEWAGPVLDRASGAENCKGSKAPPTVSEAWTSGCFRGAPS